jgi:glycogen operon protein
MHWEPLEFRLPNPPAGQSWHLLADTGRESPHDFHAPTTAPLLENTNHLSLIARSCALCLGR